MEKMKPMTRLLKDCRFWSKPTSPRIDVMESKNRPNFSSKILRNRWISAQGNDSRVIQLSHPHN